MIVETKNIDDTNLLSDFASGKIPVGTDDGKWAHITPPVLLQAIKNALGGGGSIVTPEGAEITAGNLTFDASSDAYPEGSVGKALCDLIKRFTELANSMETIVHGINDETADIDTIKEFKDFLEGYNNDKKLKDVVAGTVNEDGIVSF